MGIWDKIMDRRYISLAGVYVGGLGLSAQTALRSVVLRLRASWCAHAVGVATLRLCKLYVPSSDCHFRERPRVNNLSKTWDSCHCSRIRVDHVFKRIIMKVIPICCKDSRNLAHRILLQEAVEETSILSSANRLYGNRN